MGNFEYKVIAAPEKGLKVKGVKSPADRFALALSERMNEMAADGWDYLRTDTLPSTERSGLTSTQTVYRNVMVFRRPADSQKAATAPIIQEIEPEHFEPEELSQDIPEEDAPEEAATDDLGDHSDIAPPSKV